MRVHRSVASAAIALSLASWSLGRTAGDTLLQQDPGLTETTDAEPTLPEVLVGPGELPQASADVPTGEPAVQPSGLYDLPLSYPNLEQLRYEGLNSALRGSESIFDSPRATSIIDRIQLEERQPFTNYSQYAGDIRFDFQADPWHVLTVSPLQSQPGKVDWPLPELIESRPPTIGTFVLDRCGLGVRRPADVPARRLEDRSAETA